MKKIMLIYLCLTAQSLMAPAGDYFEPVEPTEHEKAKSRAERRAQRALDEEALLKRTAAEERLAKQRPQRPLEERNTKKASVATEPVRAQSGIHIDLAPHELNSKTGRSPFEDALKSGDIEKAKQLWEKSRNSHVTTEQFVAHLKARYSSPAALAELYPGRSYDQARDTFSEDLQKVAPHVLKILRDSFVIEHKSIQRPQARTDKAYFNWLTQHPGELIIPEGSHQETPLETAIRENSPEMAAKIFEVAKDYSTKYPKNKISPTELTEPLINNFKKMLNPKAGVRDEKAANAYAKKAIDLLEPISQEALTTFLDSYATLMGA